MCVQAMVSQRVSISDAQQYKYGYVHLGNISQNHTYMLFLIGLLPHIRNLLHDIFIREIICSNMFNNF